MAVHSIARHHTTGQSEYHRHAPQPPPSPPMEEAKCSLPSISKLLGIADAGSPTTIASPDSTSESPRVEAPSATRRQETPFTAHDSRPNSSYSQHVHYSRGLPPTPPLGSDFSFDNHSSPVTKSSRQLSTSSFSGGRFLEATPPPLDSDTRRVQVHLPQSASTVSGPQGTGQQNLPMGSFQSQAGYFHSALPATTTAQPQITNVYYQQPLPQAFPPITVPLTYAPSSGNNPWQHHHYLNPVHGTAYPQSQDRYICPTCSKAFSRPSSLRIHSHSHTGEKPFKCPQAGCGKAFSVRSNMKRHERGCHSFNINSGPPPLR
ncbi:C2H2 type zinc finger containing protein [Pochonia chlamydosporia 170]|uniref:C2H2 type zinc finger containing protein n=1 Tax=Pochonia chlamydosporia 170 TaxID=1380566 RepID=A0A179FNV3_METCM|nr:C2H2 type zinc finger containing protein [Pochonia chlamydosporia 170]OAQ67306.1 C2H2 type zinc finger containing protein [Pochonia chlamydosporia 170]